MAHRTEPECGGRVFAVDGVVLVETWELGHRHGPEIATHGAGLAVDSGRYYGVRTTVLGR